MDDLLLLLILDRVSGGAYRSVVNFVGFLVAVGLFFAHPIAGILGLIIWGVCATIAGFVDAADQREKDRKNREWVDKEYWRQEREHFETFGEWSELFPSRYKPHWQEWAEEQVMQKAENEMRDETREVWSAWAQSEYERKEEELKRQRREEMEERVRQSAAQYEAEIRAKYNFDKYDAAIQRWNDIIAANEAAAAKRRTEEEASRATTAKRVMAEEAARKERRRTWETQKAARKAAKRAWRGLSAFDNPIAET